MKRRSGSIGTTAAATTWFSAIFAATPPFPSRHQIFFVNIAQHAGHPESYSLADFNERDVAATHPDLDCPLGDAEIFSNLPLCHEPVLKGG